MDRTFDNLGGHGVVNPLAPDLCGEISKECEEIVEVFARGAARSPFATADEACLRRVESPRDLHHFQRPAYVRDAEKILHTPSYNRLAGKTQVFSFTANDDLTRRGLHVQLVARVARDIGRALGLNLDLIEAISLGHDIGHTPFGHAGERFLNEVFHERTGRWFFHNVQSVRVLDDIAARNISLQTLDGVICHNGEFVQRELRTSGITTFDEFDEMVRNAWNEGETAISRFAPATLEGCVVRISDIIAYVGKDRQDAIRAGICTEDSFDDGLGGAYNAWVLKALSADVIENSAGRSRICMSEEGFQELKRAKRENFVKIYRSDAVNEGLKGEMGALFKELYESVRRDLVEANEDAPIFRHHIRLVDRWQSFYGGVYRWEDDLDLTVTDYIASMTDGYFMALAEHLFPGSMRLFPRRDHF